MEAWKCQCGFKNIGGDVCIKCNSPYYECRHKWDGCKCIKCSKIRDEQHDWDGCKCKRCDTERHDLDGCVCKRCGAVQHSWVYFNDGLKKCIKCSVEETDRGDFKKGNKK